MLVSTKRLLLLTSILVPHILSASGYVLKYDFEGLPSVQAGPFGRAGKVIEEQASKVIEEQAGHGKVNDEQAGKVIKEDKKKPEYTWQFGKDVNECHQFPGPGEKKDGDGINIDYADGASLKLEKIALHALYEEYEGPNPNAEWSLLHTALLMGILLYDEKSKCEPTSPPMALLMPRLALNPTTSPDDLTKTPKFLDAQRFLWRDISQINALKDKKPAYFRPLYMFVHDENEEPVYPDEVHRYLNFPNNKHLYNYIPEDGDMLPFQSWEWNPHLFTKVNLGPVTEIPVVLLRSDWDGVTVENTNEQWKTLQEQWQEEIEAIEKWEAENFGPLQ